MYSYFDDFLIRTPSFTFEELKQYLFQKEFKDEDYEDLCKNKFFMDAIYIASPVLYNRIQKMLLGELDLKKKEKVQSSIIKYFIRISSRCTPYGLMAGIGIGKITNTTNLSINDCSYYSRLDMGILQSIVSMLVSQEPIREQLSYIPNNSIYTIGNNIRYIEKYIVAGNYKFKVSEIEHTSYLENLLLFSKDICSFKELTDFIVDHVEVDPDEAKEYIHELIDNQVLVDELQLGVTGDDNFDFLIKKLKFISLSPELYEFVFNLEKSIQTIKEEPENLIANINELKQNLKKYFEHQNLNNLIQIDLKSSASNITIESNLINKIKNGIYVINKLRPNNKTDTMKDFKESFRSRYEDRDILLSKVLDIETGIGYYNNSTESGLSPLLEGLPFFINIEQSDSLPWNAINKFLYEKIQKAIKQGEAVVQITKKEINIFPENTEQLPSTISVMSELLLENGQEKIKILPFGGSSATNLIARFSHLDKEIENFVLKIADFEKNFDENSIIAEIAHLPEPRAGNILARPTIREYEIPYIAKSSVDKMHTIDINDIYVSVNAYGKIYLKSKQLNKEIKPQLSTAHNYHDSSLPIYKFLCDYQNENTTNEFYLDIGPLTSLFDYIPRIEHDSVILRYATWYIQNEELKDIRNSFHSDELLRSKILEFKEKRKIPDIFILSEGDLEITISLLNIDLIKIFLNLTKNKAIISIREFLFLNQRIVKKEKSSNSYTNQLIFSFFKEK
ncbi:lantibiotic dehydratase family protein [uncultured Dokdonia sp.]|uniref:lantibiotic dehydratase family protein n=1 Tax=uncultured Dokdonia sp. TaxID=575653 RepID=UPI002614B9D8|nr:lantibiotic dehydratase family protein [uncultured Dokdonia sp.]